MKLSTLLILIALILLIIILFYLRRKALILMLTARRYGYYSKQYVRKYKSFFKMNPYPHAAKSELTEYLDFYSKIKVDKKLSNQLVLFDSQKPGTRINEMVKEVGYPDYFSIREIGNYVVDIYGYDVILFDLKAIALYFIIDKQFFLGEFTIRRDHQKVDFELLKSNLMEKYCHSADSKGDQDLLIGDREGCYIYAHDDGFAIRLKYFSRHEEGMLGVLLKEHEKIKSSFSSFSTPSSTVNF